MSVRPKQPLRKRDVHRLSRREFVYKVQKNQGRSPGHRQLGPACTCRPSSLGQASGPEDRLPRPLPAPEVTPGFPLEVSRRTTCAHTHAHTRACTRTGAHMYTHTRECTHMHMHTDEHTGTQRTHISVHKHTCTHISAHLHTCAHTCMYMHTTHMHICTHECTHMNT